MNQPHQWSIAAEPASPTLNLNQTYDNQITKDQRVVHLKVEYDHEFRQGQIWLVSFSQGQSLIYSGPLPEINQENSPWLEVLRERLQDIIMNKPLVAALYEDRQQLITTLITSSDLQESVIKIINQMQRESQPIEVRRI